MLGRGGLLLKGVNSIWKAFCGLKQENFNSTDEHFLELMLNNLTVEIGCMLKDSVVRFKNQWYWVMRFECHTPVTCHLRTTLAQKFPADYCEKLIAYQCYLCWKDDYISAQVRFLDEPPLFFNMTSSIPDAKGWKLSAVSYCVWVNVVWCVMQSSWHALLFWNRCVVTNYCIYSRVSIIWFSIMRTVNKLNHHW